MEATIILDCGHPESSHGNVTRGYGITADGKKHCYACCEARDKDTLKAETSFFAYLSSDKKQITGWPGWMLMRVTSTHKRLLGFSRDSQNYCYHIRATDVHGHKWYGTSPGPGMYARMRKVKHE
jgi:hypothetical protein